MPPPQKVWYKLSEAADHYGVSVSSVERWLAKYRSHFVVEVRGRTRYIDIESSRVPVRGMRKGPKVPEGYLTLREACARYSIRSNTLHTWVRAGHLFKVRMGPRVYIDPARSNPPRGPEGAELWRNASVPGYRVSNAGRLMDPTGAMLPEGVPEHGIRLEATGQRVRLVVRREVARAFLAGFRENGEVVHRNGNLADNRAKNLRMATPQGPRNRVRVRVTHPDGTSHVYPSLISASRSTGIHRNSIQYASYFGTKLRGMTWERL